MLRIARRGRCVTLGLKHWGLIGHSQAPWSTHTSGCAAQSPTCRSISVRPADGPSWKRSSIKGLAVGAHDNDPYLDDLFTSSLKTEITSTPNHSTRPSTSNTDDDRNRLEGRGRTNLPRTESRVALLSSLLAGAVKQDDPKRTEIVWKEIEQWLVPASGDGEIGAASADAKQSLKSPPPALPRNRQTVFDQCIGAFMSHRQPDRAVEVWNKMVAGGIQPTVFTWNAMLEGCLLVRDVKSLEEIWQRLRASGMQPDVACWTTRIHGLVTYGRREQGLQALYEMAQIWQEAAIKQLAQLGTRVSDEKKLKSMLAGMGNIGDIVKPTIATINSVVIGLFRERQGQFVQQVLDWGAALGIRPDTATYNTVLKQKIRDGEFRQALQIFKQMEKAGIQADLFTYITVLDGYFRSYPFQESSNEEQAQAVSEILKEMESAGMLDSVYPYGVVIDGLLKRHHNLPAANAVLVHMLERHVRPTPHIYTMFLSYFTLQTPPNMEAVGALWQRLQREGRGSIDVVLYSRFVKAYAGNYEVKKMMKIARKMVDEGHPQTWVTLVAMMRALVSRQQYWPEASRLVQDVVRQEGLCRHGVWGTKGSPAENEFWEVVRESRDYGVKIPDGLSLPGNKS